MGRAPCCDKVGLKRGSWTHEEDQVLISFIEKYGHSNWRALPKHAGLLRCGKSCRLRWINYLKPDIKRGNFTKEEEDAIIRLHEMMGNRWSAIALRLPGRTDNEIKNVWHTHLKKRLNNKYNQTPISKVAKKNRDNNDNSFRTSNSTSTTSNFSDTSSWTSNQVPNSSIQSYSSNDFSSIDDISSVKMPNKTLSSVRIMDAQNYDAEEREVSDELPIIDETFWSFDEFSYDDIHMDFGYPCIIKDEKISKPSQYIENGTGNQEDSLDFWLDLFVQAGGPPKLPEF